MRYPKLYFVDRAPLEKWADYCNKKSDNIEYGYDPLYLDFKIKVVVLVPVSCEVIVCLLLGGRNIYLWLFVALNILPSEVVYSIETEDIYYG